MYENLIFSKNCLMYFLFIWIMSICNVTCRICPAVFNWGYIGPSCSRLSGYSCTFYCNPGFVGSGSWLTCGKDGNWIQDTSSGFTSEYSVMKVAPDTFGAESITCDSGTCRYTKCRGSYGVLHTEAYTKDSCAWINIDLCPAVFKGGYIEPSCSRRPEVGCYYYCNHGVLKTRDWLLCRLGGNGVPDTISVCIKSGLCPSEFNGGYIESSCSRLNGVWCKYYCNPGFVRTGSWLSCGNERNWVPDTNSMCIKSDLCPAVFNGGYLEPSCSRLPGDSCTFYCNPEFVKNGNRLTCGEDGKWIQDTYSICIKSVDPTSSYSESRRTIGGAIAGITTAVLIIMMIIVAIVVWISKRSSLRKSQRRVPSHAGGTCLRPRENPDQNITTLRQQPNADGMESVSSFESPSYNGLYVHSFVQRIPKISSSYKYPVPPPSYRETQIATNESPPTYKEVVMDPTRFNLFT